MVDYSAILREMVIEALLSVGRIKPNDTEKYSKWRVTSRRYADGQGYKIGLKHPASPARIFLREDLPQERILNNLLLREIYIEFPSTYIQLVEGVRRTDGLDSLNERLDRELSEVVSWEKH